MNATKWVITFADLIDDEAITEPGTVVTKTIHVTCTDRAAAGELIGSIYDEFGPVEGITATEVAATWECDGRDNCMVVA